jgi:hypothetical protein
MGDLMRPTAFAVALLVTGLPFLTHAQQPVTAQATMVEERAYLKALPGQRETLARFIVANWFEMDRIAMTQPNPIFTRYRLYENGHNEGDWDLVVVVGYPNATGFDDPETQRRFNEIRRAHKTVLIEGKGLRDLGSIVRTERARPREGSN